MKKVFVVIYGPTGVGKTDFALKLAQRLRGCVEIINADMGQLYEPLTIGTAKPPLNNVPVLHHLFNIIDTPQDFNVLEWRKRVIEIMNELWAQGKVPVLVGGSGFYIKSLFFPPLCTTTLPQSALANKETAELYKELLVIDPERAKDVHPHDKYRIMRALEIWYSCGIKPTDLHPVFDPPGCAYLYCLIREKNELYGRINERVKEMVNQGWIEEVEHLGPEWWHYLEQKKLLGYPEIIEVIRGELTLVQAIEKISKLTRNYAKRQLTFWRYLKRELMKADKDHTFIKELQDLNLTLLNTDLYLEKLAKSIRLQNICL